MTASPTRRRLLGTLAASTLLAACGPRGATLQGSVPQGAITLGWRLVPGMQLTWRTVVTRTARPVHISRAEQWTFRVLELDRAGVATLQGHLSGFGGGVKVHDRPLPESLLEPAREAEQGRRQPVTLRLGMDGRLVSTSEPGFDASLPHRALALHLPEAPVVPHESWPDPDLVRPFQALLPQELAVRAESTARLLELYRHEGRIAAVLESQGRLRTEGGPTLLVTGSATWDAERGVLLRRTLEARLSPALADPIREPGVLQLTLHLV